MGEKLKCYTWIENSNHLSNKNSKENGKTLFIFPPMKKNKDLKFSWTSKKETKKLYTHTFTFTRCKLICPIRSGNIIMDFMFLKNNGRLFVEKGRRTSWLAGWANPGFGHSFYNCNWGPAHRTLGKFSSRYHWLVLCKSGLR